MTERDGSPTTQNYDVYRWSVVQVGKGTIKWTMTISQPVPASRGAWQMCESPLNGLAVRCSYHSRFHPIR